MESATWCRTPAAASAARRLRPEVSKNSSTALSSKEGELARSITTCAPARASLSPSPVMLLIPLWGEAATTSWPPWRRMATVFEPIRPVPPMTTLFMGYPPLSTTGEPLNGFECKCERHGERRVQHGRLGVCLLTGLHYARALRPRYFPQCRAGTACLIDEA